jgi:hypothetical protein
MFQRDHFPRLKQQQRALAIYHFSEPDQHNERTIVIQKTQKEGKGHREGDLFITEAVAYEIQLNSPSTRDGYPLIYGTSIDFECLYCLEGGLTDHIELS